MRLAQTAPMTQVRAIASQTLRQLQTRNAAPAPASAVAEQAHRQLVVDDIKRFFEQSADTDASGRDAAAAARRADRRLRAWTICWASTGAGSGAGSMRAHGDRALPPPAGFPYARGVWLYRQGSSIPTCAR